MKALIFILTIFLMGCGTSSGTKSYSDRQAISGVITEQTLIRGFERLAQSGYFANTQMTNITGSRLRWVSDWNYFAHSRIDEEDIDRGIFDARSRLHITAAARNRNQLDPRRTNMYGTVRVHIEFQVRTENNPNFHTVDLYGYHKEEWKRVSFSLNSLLSSGVQFY